MIFSLQSQILVEITEILKTEFNLSQACRIVITESDYLNQIKKQVKAQIHHVSQKNSRITAYFLCVTDLLHERYEQKKK